MTSAPHEIPLVSSRVRWIALFLLAALLVLLAIRLSSSESLRETLSQKQVQLVHATTQTAEEIPPVIIVGPPHIVFESVILMLIAAATAALAGFSKGLPRARLGQFLLITLFLACGFQSVLLAGNRFNAVIGLVDIAMALMAGWTLSLLCDLLDEQGRRLAIAGLIAILTLWVCKGLLQYFVEIPDTIAMFRKNHDEYLRSQGIHDPVQATLFDARLNAREVSGYIAASNVFANGLIGFIAILVGVIFCGFRSMRSQMIAVPAPRRSKPRSTASERSITISSQTLSLIFVGVLAIAALTLLPLSGSKGGTALGFFTTFIVFAVGIFWKQVVAYRKTFFSIFLLAISGIAGLTFFYGVHYDALPSKSLLFRWHYWTAAEKMIRQSPVWGIGLNNFGDLYMQFKRPSSPEDVKDPHNFFIRIAAEMGLPAAALIGILLGWFIWNSYRNTRSQPLPVDSVQASVKKIRPVVMIAGTLIALCWAAVHLLFFTEPVEFNLYIAVIFAFVAAGAFGIIMILLSKRSFNLPAMHYLCLTATLGAGAMLAYDLINMALVTGPVAMLFWMLMGIGDSLTSPAVQKPSTLVRTHAFVVSIACAGTALFLFLALWKPLVSSSFPWDPAPFERQYLQKYAAGDSRGARTALETAMQRSPNSIELLMQHIALLRDVFREPVAPEIHKVLSLDHANAHIRIQLGLINSDLPPVERATILQKALDLDRQLPDDEIKRLPPEEISAVRKKIDDLLSNNP